MAILIVEHNGGKRGAVLPDRVLIGRRSMNHLVLEDPAVSRMHAWVERWENAWVLTDMRSRTGTRVNGQPVGKYKPLTDGDVIELGSARLTFRTADRVPLDVEPFELPRVPTVSAKDVGIRFDCPTCWAPMWAAAEFAGNAGACVFCGNTFVVPRESIAPPPPPPPPAVPNPYALPPTEELVSREVRLETLQVKGDPATAPPDLAPAELALTPPARVGSPA
ncbi:MAG TPA: FHA domain-containing protein, partial [Humisphaera sp.]